MSPCSATFDRIPMNQLVRHARIHSGPIVALEASLDIADANTRNLLLRLAEEMRHPGFASSMLVELIVAQLTIELGPLFRAIRRAAGGRLVWHAGGCSSSTSGWRTAQQMPTLSELAALCKLSVRQLTRGFRASRSCSIGDYVVNSRIVRAKRHAGRARPASRASPILWAFASSSAFCFAFRRATGMTTGVFRATGSAREFTTRSAARWKS